MGWCLKVLMKYPGFCRALLPSHSSPPTPTPHPHPSLTLPSLTPKAVAANDGKNWKKIAQDLPGRTDVQCLHRWQKVLRPGLVKGPWTEEEDEIVR